MSGKDIKVLYIGGCVRSGSTLLGRILGQVDGFHFAGELKYVWRAGFIENQLCSCGVPFKECNFWKAVVEEAYGGFGPNIDEIIKLRSRVEHMRYLPQLTSHSKTSDYLEKFPELKEYSIVLGNLYAAIQKVSGSQVIVDSSKSPSYIYTLNALPSIDLRVVHLVRDSRAVAHSLLRKKLKPEIQGKRVYMAQSTPLVSSTAWLLYNVFLETLMYCNSKCLLIRYEDFIDHPSNTLSRILSLVQRNGSHIPLTSDRKIAFKPDHTIAGNPMRFEQGKVELRRDDEWKTKMQRGHKYLVTALTWPLLMKYGYFNNDAGDCLAQP